MRLVSKDKGRVICLATGIRDVYRSHEDSNYFPFILPVSNFRASKWGPHRSAKRALSSSLFQLLKKHYLTSSSNAMKEDYELEDDDNDYEELSEPEEVSNEQVRI